MKNIKIYILFAVFCFVGCKAVKSWVGLGEEKSEQTEQSVSTKKIVPPTKVPITSKTVGNFLVYCVITLVVLLAIRYGVKMIKRKDE